MEEDEHYTLAMHGTKREWTQLRDVFQYFVDIGKYEHYPNRPTHTDLSAWRNVFDKAVNSDKYEKCNCKGPSLI